MKYLLALSLVLSITACSKDKGSSSPTFGSNKPIIPDSGSSIVINPNDPSEPQVQVDGTVVQKPFESLNLSINYAKSQATITIKKEDANRLFNRLAIVSEGKTESSKGSKVGKHITCSSEVCSLNVDLKEAEVVANENVGKRFSKRFPSLLSYNGSNLKINNLKKVGEIFITETEAEMLFKAISLKEVVKSNDKDVMEKVGAGEAGMTCKQTTEEAKVSYKCSVRFSVVDGTVIAPK